MKKCPFCAEEIQDTAIKCRYCAEFLDRPRKQTADPAPDDAPEQKKLLHRNISTVIAILVLGPFALPMIISNPHYSKLTKFLISTFVIALTIILCVVAVKLCIYIYEQISSIIPNLLA